jgi:hypothetical protein
MFRECQVFKHGERSVYKSIKTENPQKIFTVIASFILNYWAFFYGVGWASFNYSGVLNSKKRDYSPDAFLW